MQERRRRRRKRKKGMRKQRKGELPFILRCLITGAVRAFFLELAHCLCVFKGYQPIAVLELRLCLENPLPKGRSGRKTMSRAKGELSGRVNLTVWYSSQSRSKTSCLFSPPDLCE